MNIKYATISANIAIGADGYSVNNVNGLMITKYIDFGIMSMVHIVVTKPSQPVGG